MFYFKKRLNTMLIISDDLNKLKILSNNPDII